MGVVYLGDLEELKSTGVPSKHSRATDALRERMVKLINERNSIQSEEIDEILNEVMLDVEHEEEREAREGETFEESVDITLRPEEALIYFRRSKHGTVAFR